MQRAMCHGRLRRGEADHSVLEGHVEPARARPADACARFRTRGELVEGNGVETVPIKHAAPGGVEVVRQAATLSRALAVASRLAPAEPRALRSRPSAGGGGRSGGLMVWRESEPNLDGPSAPVRALLGAGGRLRLDAGRPRIPRGLRAL